MSDSQHATLLRRMARAQDQPAAENPLTTSRAVRLALTKAANDTTGLVLSVKDVQEVQLALDDMLAQLDDGLMLIALQRGSEVAGLIALDMQMRAAILEVQTVGALINAVAEDRAPTGTDQTLATPLIKAFLAAFAEAVIGMELEGWVDQTEPGNRLSGTRDAGLTLTDCAYRMVRMDVDLGVAERQGIISVALPLAHAEPESTPVEEKPVNWAEAFPANVAEAPARLDALLHKFHVSLARAQSLQVGTILPLPGCTVESVRLLAEDGQVVANAKLGQMGGKRAVRLQAAPKAELAELGQPTSSQMAEPALMPEAEPLGLALDTPEPAGDLLGADEETELLGEGFPALDMSEMPGAPLSD